MREKNIAYAIFDFDGTISLIRDGWESVMEHCLVSWVSNNACSNEKLAEIKKDAKLLIDVTTGMNTIFQMDEAIELIRKHDCVAEKDIKTPEDYKYEYLSMLENKIRHRKDEIKRSGATNKYIVPGAVDFLKHLKALGIYMVVLSGTDEKDVKAELELLGLNSYFNKVFGAEKRRDKRDVLDRLFERQDIIPNSSLIVGDGPIEISLGSEHGCKTLGVCMPSDKSQVEMCKRKRLLLTNSGADLLVRDFSDLNYILRHIF